MASLTWAPLSTGIINYFQHNNVCQERPLEPTAAPNKERLAVTDLCSNEVVAGVQGCEKDSFDNTVMVTLYRKLALLGQL